MGEISLAQPISLKLWLCVVVGMLLATLTFLLATEVYRKEQVKGLLVPSGGLLHVLANQGGTVVNLFVHEGAEVNKGDPLFTLVNERGSSVKQQLAPLVLAELEHRLKLSEESEAGASRLLAEEMAELEREAQQLVLQGDSLRTQQSLLAQRTRLQIKKVQANQVLVSQGQLGALRLSESEDELLRLKQAETELDSELKNIAAMLANNAGKLRKQPLQHEQTLRIYASEQSELKQQIEEVRANFRTVMPASEAGRITAVQVHPGQLVTPGDPVLTMVPRNSVLLAELDLPSRAAGLVKDGHKVRLRFDAFPYQQFGQIRAEVLQVDKTLLRPDWRRELSAAEPVYRLRAFLERDAVERNGQTFPLRAGMQVEADILLERHRLLDWVLKPLLGFNARTSEV